MDILKASVTTLHLGNSHRYVSVAIGHMSIPATIRFPLNWRSAASPERKIYRAL